MLKGELPSAEVEIGMRRVAYLKVGFVEGRLINAVQLYRFRSELASMLEIAPDEIGFSAELDAYLGLPTSSPEPNLKNKGAALNSLLKSVALIKANCSDLALLSNYLWELAGYINLFSKLAIPSAVRRVPILQKAYVAFARLESIALGLETARDTSLEAPIGNASKCFEFNYLLEGASGAASTVHSLHSATDLAALIAPGGLSIFGGQRPLGVIACERVGDVKALGFRGHK